MTIQIGTLEISPALEHKDLLARVVIEGLGNLNNADKIGITEIDPEVSDTTAFCEHYQLELNQAANCIVLEAKRGDKVWYAACVVLGNTRADVNGLARKTLGARRVSFAAMDTAVDMTNMEYGAITPIGLPEDWVILVDKAVADSDYIVIGSGLRKSKLIVPGKIFSSLPNSQILDGLGKVIK